MGEKKRLQGLMPRLFEQIFFYNNLLSQLVSDNQMNIQLVGKTADTCQQLYASGVFLRGASDPKKMEKRNSEIKQQQQQQPKNDKRINK